MKIVRADLSHAEGIAALNRQCLMQGWSFESIANDISKHNYYAAVEDGKVIAYACLWFIPPEAELEDICVEPEMRRRGIAQALMEHFIEDAVNSGIDTVILEVRASNAPAITLYEKNGFVRSGVRKAYYDNREDAIIMVKAI